MTPALGSVGICRGLGRATLSNPRGLVALGVNTGGVVCLGRTALQYFQNYFLICFSVPLFWVVVLHPLGNHFLPLVREDPAYRFLLGPP